MLVPLSRTATATHPPACLDLTPETSVGEIGREPLVVVAVLRQQVASCTSGSVAAPEGVAIDFEIAGPGDTDAGNTPDTPDLSCSIPVNGASCSVQYLSNAAGTDTIRGWIDHDGASPPSGVTEADPGETQPQGDEDITDVITREWISDPAVTVDCDDQGLPQTEDELNPGGDPFDKSPELYRCTARNAAGSAPRNSGVIKVEVLNGINDPDSVDGASFEQNDASCAFSGAREHPSSAGVCNLVVHQTEGESGIAFLCFWSGTGAVGQSACGNEPYDEATNADGSDTGNDIADAVRLEWQAPSAALGGVDAEPEQDWNELGQQHVVRATIYDQFGKLLSGTTQVNLELFQGSPGDTDGNTPGTPDKTCTTANASFCTVTYTETDTAGTDLICVWTDEAPAMSGTNAGGTCDGEGVDDPDDTSGSADAPTPSGDDVDVVRKTWIDPATPTRLDCTPEEDENPPGTSHTITCTARNSSGALIQGAEVDVEATGANDPDAGDTPGTPDFGCTTGVEGACSFTHGSGGTGSTAALDRTFYRAWIDGDGPASVDADLTERRDEFSFPGERDEPDTTDVVTKLWGGPVPAGVDATPEWATSNLGEQHTITVTLLDEQRQPMVGNVVVKFEFFAGSPSDTDLNTPETPDATCTTVDSSTCSFSYTLSGDVGGSDLICVFAGEPPGMTGTNTERATCDDADNQYGTEPVNAEVDLVSKWWHAGPHPTAVDCDDSTGPNRDDETNASSLGLGSAETYTCTLLAGGGAGVGAGLVVRGEVMTHVNDPDSPDGATFGSPDFSCTTAPSSACQITVTQAEDEVGETAICFYYGTPTQAGTLCSSEPPGEGQAADGSDAGNDLADATLLRWTAPPPGPPASYLDCDDAGPPATEDEANPTSSGTAGNETYTCRATDADGNPVANGVVKGEVTGAVNDPDAADGPSYESVDYGCTTGADGVCLVTVTQHENEPGSTLVCFYIGDAAQGEARCGAEPYDESTSPDLSDSPNDLADTVRLEWQTRVAMGLDVEPESATSLLGTQHVVTAIVYDQFGDRFAGNTHVKLEWFTGSPSDFEGNTPGTPDRSCTTVNHSQCSIAYTQANLAGTDVFCGWFGTAPPMSGTNGAPVCNGEALTDPGDVPGQADPPQPRGDRVDLVSKTWEASSSVRLDCDDSNPPPTEDEINPALSGPASNEVYTCRVTDASGSSVAQSVVRGEVTASVNDPDATDGASYASPDYSCTTTAAGTCQITVTQNESETGVTFVCFWSGDAAQGQSACASEAHDEVVATDMSDAGNDSADAVRLEWQQRIATGLDVEPESATTPLGTQHLVTAIVYDQFGERFVGNTQVKLEWFTGSPSDYEGNTPATPDRSCTTVNNSQCSIAYTQANLAGTDVFCGWIGAVPSMSGTSSTPTCAGEGLSDPDDAAGVPDAPMPAGDAVDLIAKTWT